MGNLTIAGSITGTLSEFVAYDDEASPVAGHFWITGDVWNGQERVETEFKVLVNGFWGNRGKRFEGKRVCVMFHRIAFDVWTNEDGTSNGIIVLTATYMDLN